MSIPYIKRNDQYDMAKKTAKYGHVTEAMQNDGADKMQRFIESL
jgi:hypothetical protein